STRRSRSKKSEVGSTKYEVCERRNRRDAETQIALRFERALSAVRLQTFRLRTSNFRLSLRSLEPSHQHSLSEDVSVDRFQHVGAGRVGTEIELRVERVQLPGGVMIRSDRRRAGPAKADHSALSLDLHRAVG